MPRRIPRHRCKKFAKSYRKNHPEHIQNAITHTMKRIRERYNLDFTFTQVQDLGNRALRQAEYLGDCQQGDDCVYCRMTVRRTQIYFIYSLRLRTFVTALSRDMLINDNTPWRHTLSERMSPTGETA
ncbi:hypothetical protein [Deinococcus misasensis]|uniref:hypothetical protein n=1 Tax=Deinococcus misasensis TaxID=392413 RepID=UPI00054D5315|nr:hypothetical protein [Deinococcus misasensis]